MGEKSRPLTRAEAARLAGVSEAELRGREGNYRDRDKHDAFSPRDEGTAERGRLSSNKGAFRSTVYADKPAGATPENPSGPQPAAPSADACERGQISATQHLYLANCV